MENKTNLGTPLYWLRNESDDSKLLGLEGGGRSRGVFCSFSFACDSRATQARFCFPASPLIY